MEFELNALYPFPAPTTVTQPAHSPSLKQVSPSTRDVLFKNHVSCLLLREQWFNEYRYICSTLFAVGLLSSSLLTIRTFCTPPVFIRCLLIRVSFRKFRTEPFSDSSQSPLCVPRDISTCSYLVLLKYCSPHFRRVLAGFIINMAQN